MTKIIFISGMHGVGKGVLCQSLQQILGYPAYSCSDLIKKYSTYIEVDKAVEDAEKNQLSLLIGLREIKNECILLDGHFCLVGRDGDIIELGYETFDAIAPCKIVNVTCDEDVVYQRLKSRDGASLGIDVLKKLQAAELRRTIEYSGTRKVPFVSYESGNDTDELIEWLRG